MPVKRDTKAVKKPKAAEAVESEKVPFEPEEKDAAEAFDEVAERLRKQRTEGLADVQVVAHTLAELKARVDAFSKELEAVTAREVARVRAEVEERAGMQAVLRGKDVEGAEKLVKLQIANLDKIVKEQASRIEELQAEVKVANEKAQALALKVIEGTAGGSAFARSSEPSPPRP